MIGQNRTVSVVGLGYVGLPVAVAFGKVHKTVGFDIKADRIEELKNNFDRTGRSLKRISNPPIFSLPTE